MKILLNHFKLLLLLYIFIFIDFAIELDFSKEQKGTTSFICITLALLTLISYLIKKNSSKGFFVNNHGFLWVTNDGTYKYPWNDLKIKILVNIPLFKVIEISSGKKPKYRLLISWLVENKGLSEIKKTCPKNHELYKHISDYFNRKKS